MNALLEKELDAIDAENLSKELDEIDKKKKLDEELNAIDAINAKQEKVASYRKNEINPLQQASLGVSKYVEATAPAEIGGLMNIGLQVPKSARFAGGGLAGPFGLAAGAASGLFENQLRNLSRDIQQGAVATGKEYEQLSEGIGKSKVGQFIGGLGESVTGMVPQLIGSRLGGMPGSIGVSAAQTLGITFTDAIEGYKRQGLSQEEAEKKAVLPSVLNSVATAAITAAMGKTGLDADKFKVGLKEAAKQFGLEATEEGLQNVAQSIIQKASYNPELTFKDAAVGTLLSGLSGGIITLGPSALSNLTSKFTKQGEQPPPFPNKPPPLPGQKVAETPEEAKIQSTILTDPEQEYDPANITELTDDEIVGYKPAGEPNAIPEQGTDAIPVQPASRVGETVGEQVRNAEELTGEKAQETTQVTPEQLKGGVTNEETQRQEVLNQTVEPGVTEPSVAPVQPEAEAQPKTEPTAYEKTIQVLDDLIKKTDFDPKTFNEGITGAPVWLVKGVANGSLRIVKASIQAGKTAADAVADGIAWLKSQNIKDFNEEEATKWLNQTWNEPIRQESKGLFVGQYEPVAMKQLDQDADTFINAFPDIGTATEKLLSPVSNIDLNVQRVVATKLLQRATDDYEASKKLVNETKGVDQINKLRLMRQKKDIRDRLANVLQQEGSGKGQALAVVRHANKMIEHLMPILSFEGLVKRKQEKIKRIVNPETFQTGSKVINESSRNAGNQVADAVKGVKPVSVEEKTAQQLINQYANIQKDTPEWKKVEQNKVIKLFNDYLKGDVTKEQFTTGLTQFGINENTIGILNRVADQELSARAANRYAKTTAEINTLIENDKKVYGILRKVASETDIDFRDLFKNMTQDSQIERRNELYNAIKQHPKLQGMTEVQARQLEAALTKAWETARKKTVESEIKRIFKTKNPDDAKKVKAALPKILQWSNMGMLDEQHFRDAIAQKFGLPTLDSKIADDLRKMSQEAQKAPDGVIKNKILDKMAFRMLDAGFTWKDLVRDVWFANVLSSVRTLGDVVLGNLGNGTLSMLNSMAYTTATGNPMLAVNMASRYANGIVEGAMNAYDIIKTGDYSRSPTFYAKIQDVLNGTAKPNTLEYFKKHGKGWQKAVGQLAYSSRAIAALDYISSIALREGMMPYVALTRKDMASLNNMTKKDYANDVKQAEEQAKQELGPDAKKVDLLARKREILESQISQDVKDGAAQLGAEVALNADLNQGLSGFVYRVLTQGPQSNFFFRAIAGTTFIRSVLNFANMVSTYAPGLGALNYTRAIVGQSERAPEFMRKYFGLQLPPEKKAQILAAQVMSVMLSAGIHELFMPDDKGEFKKGMQLTGGLYGLDYNTKKKLSTFKIEPYKIIINGKAYSYKQTAIAPLLAFFGNMSDAMRYRKDTDKYKEKSNIEKKIDAVTMSMMFIKDVSALSQLSNLIGAASNTQAPESDTVLKRFAAAGGSSLSGLIPASSMLKDIDSMADTALYRKNSGFEYWVSNIPFARRLVGQGPELNILGDEVNAARYPWGRWMSTVKDEPIYQVLAEKAAQGMFPPLPGEDVQIYDPKTNKKRDMNEKEIYKYKEFYLKEQGKKLRQDIDRIRGMNEQQWKYYTDREFDSMRTWARNQVKPIE